MKIIKLDRRYSANREYGHTVALWFDRWLGTCATAYEDAATELYGSQYAYELNHTQTWRARFGRAPGRANNRPYVISFKDEAMLTMLMLKVGADRDSY